MRLKNILFVVRDLEVSIAFYKELFGLEVLADLGGNVMLTEGLVLQEQTLWETCTGKKVAAGGNDAVLYFEENNMEAFAERLAHASFPIEFVTEYGEHESGRRLIRICDPDRHVIEIRESAECAARRHS